MSDSTLNPVPPYTVLAADRPPFVYVVSSFPTIRCLGPTAPVHLATIVHHVQLITKGVGCCTLLAPFTECMILFDSWH